LCFHGLSGWFKLSRCIASLLYLAETPRSLARIRQQYTPPNGRHNELFDA